MLEVYLCSNLRQVETFGLLVDHNHSPKEYFEGCSQCFAYEYEKILFCRDFSAFSIVEILEAFFSEEKSKFQSGYF